LLGRPGYLRRRMIMKTTDKSRELVRTVIVFVALLVAGIVLAVGVPSAVESAFDKSVLVSMGSALVGGALAFFLVEMFRQNRAD
jgi:protein-S-isoprenylcysteine O-methyltransferase Ste14